MSLFWIIPVVLCGFGIALIVYGIRYNKEDYEHTKRYGTNYSGGSVSDTFIGALVEFIFVVVIDRFVRFFPKWLIKAFLFVIGIAFIVLGVYIFSDMPSKT
ncbi:hypothetical protein AWM68_11875 [Fictibacillus phosphorivorans]|uniref:Uncharacterized protein n=1 Tax=Fictibacillus phosphorivorans TaxID=1221500 RepID=A0A165MXG8_9BACL|nr:hypothetical protein [Fictibacillus phosphorivorans]KZE63807.1 hypothetical protein AWM68_11875 [Fictibacillus phosphorivorans]